MARAKKQVDYIISEKGASKAAGGFKKVDKALNKAAKSAAKYAAGYLGVRGIINITKQAIEAFGIQEDAEKKLTVALGKNADALFKQASALQQVTTYGDEAIIGVQSSIAAFTKNEEEIKKTTEATLDFASAMGFDLKSAGDLIAKTLGSSTNALTRYGVEVTGAVGSTERLKTLTEGIARLWGGQAAAAAETMAGALSQMKNATGDLSEAMGELLSGPVTVWAKKTKEIAENLTEMFNVTQTMTDQDNINQLTQEYTDLENQIKRLADVEFANELAPGTHTLAKIRDLRIEQNEIDKKREALMVLIIERNKELKAAEEALIPVIEEVNNKSEEQAVALEVIESEYLRLLPVMDQFTNSIVQAAVYGQDMGDAVVSALKAISAQLVADAAIYALFTLFTGGTLSGAGLGLALFPKSTASPDMLPRATAPTTTNNSTTLNFSGNITDRAYVREFLIPEIQNAVRLNA